MDGPSTGEVVVTLAILAHAFAYWIKTPKESDNELNSKMENLDKEVNTKFDNIDRRVTTLEIEHAGSYAALSTTVDSLKTNLVELRQAIDRLSERIPLPGARHVARAKR